MQNKEFILYANQLIAVSQVAIPAIQKLIAAVRDYAEKSKDGVTEQEMKEQYDRIILLSDAVLKPLPPLPDSGTENG